MKQKNLVLFQNQLIRNNNQIIFKENFLMLNLFNKVRSLNNSFIFYKKKNNLTNIMIIFIY